MKQIHTVKYISFSLSIFFSYIFLLCSYANADALVYNVMKGNTIVGEFKIERKKNNDIVELNSYSVVKVNMLVTVKVTDKMRVVFRGNRMDHAELYRTLNGLVRVNNTISWDGNSYQMTDKNKVVKKLHHEVLHSTASLYYFEPVNISSVFSENFQKMIPIKRMGNSKYLLELPNGNKTSYSYTNGICTLVEAETDWADIRFVFQKRIL